MGRRCIFYFALDANWACKKGALKGYPVTPERDIQAEIWEAMSRFSVLFRNNTGAIKSKTGFIRFGLVKGSSDLIGWTRVEITQEMVGQTVAVFTAPECKTETGRATPAQLHFLERVRLDGGYAGIVRSVEDALKMIGKNKGNRR